MGLETFLKLSSGFGEPCGSPTEPPPPPSTLKARTSGVGACSKRREVRVGSRVSLYDMRYPKE